jgi:hypothetical protein
MADFDPEETAPVEDDGRVDDILGRKRARRRRHPPIELKHPLYDLPDQYPTGDSSWHVLGAEEWDYISEE